jgi:putative iron-dependent peroxidase
MQSAILTGVPRVARYMSFSLRADAAQATSIEPVQAISIDDSIVVGIGEPLIAHWRSSISGLRTFPAISGPGVQVPSTQLALWCWLRGDDQGELVKRSISISDSLSSHYVLEQTVDGFKFGDANLGKDLTGYEDGTENPTGDKAIEAAFINDVAEGMAGSSFVAVQQWTHDLRTFAAFSQSEQDHIIGRRISDNSEIEDAPASAHVKRTEQESFSPPAFVLRRSMPFTGARRDGLVFVAFGRTLDAFEVQLKRMAGIEDGIPDALFRFSHPVSGAYYWCPPVRDGQLNLDAVQR